MCVRVRARASANGFACAPARGQTHEVCCLGFFLPRDKEQVPVLMKYTRGLGHQGICLECRNVRIRHTERVLCLKLVQQHRARAEGLARAPGEGFDGTTVLI